MLILVDLMLSIVNNMYIKIYKKYQKELEMLRNRVKELRARHNFSQTDIADRVGVTRQTIGFIEKGDFSPSITLSLKLAKELQVGVHELFWLEEEEKNE